MLFAGAQLQLEPLPGQRSQITVLQFRFQTLGIVRQPLQFKMQAIPPFAESGVGFGKQPWNAGDGGKFSFAAAASVVFAVRSQWRLVAARTGEKVGQRAYGWHREDFGIRNRALWRAGVPDHKKQGRLLELQEPVALFQVYAGANGPIVPLTMASNAVMLSRRLESPRP